MATSKQLKDAIERCIENARRSHPTDVDVRARNFVATLSGSLQAMDDQALSDKLFSILKDQE